MGIGGWILLIFAVVVGIYACVVMDKAKSRCHKGGCTKCGAATGCARTRNNLKTFRGVFLQDRKTPSCCLSSMKNQPL